ncbi:MAG: hypothetical protein ACQERR_07380 [Pseudomonadota bacterium]
MIDTPLLDAVDDNEGIAEPVTTALEGEEPDVLLVAVADEAVRAYKARSLDERLALALLPEPEAIDRRLIVEIEQWMQVRCYFARRLDLRPHEINAFLGDDDHVIRLCIAKRTDLGAEQIARCVADRDPNVRHAIARNPDLTPEQRRQLLTDEDDIVRQAAARGPRTMRTRQRPGQTKLVR